MAVVTAAVGAAMVIGAGAIADGKAQKAASKARDQKNDAKFQMEAARRDRQDIINPYAGITDLSGLASDLSSQITNPFNSLQVSTAAAEMQAEEADISLANALDTLEMTGASAGGATALAMAALKSKKGVAADIQQQEAKNAELRAHGERAAQDAQVAATTRYQNVTIEAGARAEDAAAQGQIFEFQAQEARTNADINMYQNMYQGFAQQQNQAEIASSAAWGSVASGLGSIVGGVVSGPLAAAGGGGGAAASVGSGITGGGTLPGSGGAIGSGGIGGTGSWTPGMVLSDRKLKKNIKLIGKSPSGLKIYAFEFINKIFGEGRFQGVMSDEIPQEVVIKYQDGYDRVDYSKLDVEFKRI